MLRILNSQWYSSYVLWPFSVDLLRLKQLVIDFRPVSDQCATCLRHVHASLDRQIDKHLFQMQQDGWNDTMHIGHVRRGLWPGSQLGRIKECTVVLMSYAVVLLFFIFDVFHFVSLHLFPVNSKNTQRYVMILFGWILFYCVFVALTEIILSLIHDAH